MKLERFLKKHIFKFLAIVCIILLILNGSLKGKKCNKKKVKEGLVTCKNTCSDLTDGRVDFSNLQLNINKIMELFSRLKGHCKNRCTDNDPAPAASNEEPPRISVGASS
tara:strand:+ start:149 stop:475 length:327 start_codon:yes stop_codon:yes gene_type:complete